MPLTVPSAPGLTLKAETFITVPVDRVNFAGLSVNADRAYTLQYQINLSAFGTNQEVVPLTNNDSVFSLTVLNRRMTLCTAGAPTCQTTGFLPLQNGVTTETFGTITWRRANQPLSNANGGFAVQSRYAGSSVDGHGYGSYIYDQPIADITQVGLIMVNAGTNVIGLTIIDVGSVFRLYEGAG